MQFTDNTDGPDAAFRHDAGFDDTPEHLSSLAYLNIHRRRKTRAVNGFYEDLL